MINIVNVLVGLGFIGTTFAAVYYSCAYSRVLDMTERSLDTIEKIVAELNVVKEDRDYWRDMAVEMTDNYIDELDLPEPTVGENISMNYVEQLCHITGLDNPLADIDRDKCLKDLTKEEWESIRTLKEELPVRFANIEWEEDDADDYYKDIFRELMGEFGCMI